MENNKTNELHESAFVDLSDKKTIGVLRQRAKNKIVLFKEIGTTDCVNKKTGKNTTLILGVGSITGSCMVLAEDKYFELPWSDIVALAINSGILEADKNETN